MKVRVSGLVWLPTGSLAPHQILNIKNQLTVYPKKTTDIGNKSDPPPIFMFDEREGFLGIPRGFYLNMSSGQHDEDLDVSFGRPMREFGTKYKSDGHFIEQESVLRMFAHRMEDRKWGGFLLKAGCGFGKCVREDTLVSTRDGLKRIGELVPEHLDDEECEVDLFVDTKDGMRPSKFAYAKKSAPCIKMTTSRGYQVSGTYGHPVLALCDTGFEWKRLSDMSVGDNIVIRASALQGSPISWRENSSVLSGTMSVDDAYVMGMLTGDGSVCNGVISFFSEDDELASSFIEYFDSCGLNVSTDRRDGKCPAYHIRDGGAAFLRELEWAGLSTTTAHYKSVPWSVLEGGIGIASAFLSGLFDTDGSVNTDTMFIDLTSASERLLRDVQVLLLGLGVRSSVSVKDGVYNGDRVYHWRLLVHRFDVSSFVEAVGFRLGRNRALADAICSEMSNGDRNPNIYTVPVGGLMKSESGNHNPSVSQVKRFISEASLGNSKFWSEFIRGDLSFDRVASLENDDERRVCDISVEAGRNFVANGIVVHNTITALEFARRVGRKTLILVHQEFFLDQWKERIEDMMPDARVGIIRQKKCDYEGHDFVIGMLQSLARDDGTKYPKEMYRAFGMIINDECFCGNTFVKTISGDKRIGDVEEGDVVLNAVGVGRVDGLFSKLAPVSDVRLVRMSDGSEYVCTRDHPWLTEIGWIDAGDLAGKAVLTSRDSIGIMLNHGTKKAADLSYMWEDQFGEIWENVLFQKLYRGVKEGGVPSALAVRDRAREAWSQSFLFEELYREMDFGESIAVFGESFGGHKEVAQGQPAYSCGGVGKDDEKEPDATSRDEAEGFVSKGIKVDSVSIPERSDFERLGINVVDDHVRVFNLKVSGHPSYVLDGGVVVHNCHRVGAATWAEIIPRFYAAWRVGLSVSPDSWVELVGGSFGKGWIGRIEDAYLIARDGMEEEHVEGYSIVRPEGVMSRGWGGKAFEWKPVRSMIRHVCDREVVRVVSSGVPLIATSDHSVYRASVDGYVRRHNKKKPIFKLDCIGAGDLSKDDTLIVDDGNSWSNIVTCDLFDVAGFLTSSSGKNLSKIHVSLDLSSVSRLDLGVTSKAWFRFRNGKYGDRLPVLDYIRHRGVVGGARFLYSEGCRGATVDPLLDMESLAWMFGFFLGDGWVSGNRVCFAVESGILDYVVQRLSSLKHVRWSAKVREMDGKSYEVRCSNSIFAAIVAHFAGAKCSDKRIPAEWIIGWGHSAKMELLQGLIDSGGHVSNTTSSRNRSRFYYVTTSLGLARDLLSLLRSVGIAGSFHSPTGGGVVNGRRIQGKLTKYVVHWSAFAGLGHDDHRGNRRRYEHAGVSFLESNIRLVEPADRPEYVYDFEMDGHPSFVADGVLVHNSATPRRKDGAQDVFFNHISQITYSAETEAQVPKLRKLSVYSQLKPIRRGKYYVPTANLNSAQVLTQLGNDGFRSKDIVDDVVRAVKAGRKVMVVSERINHLKMMSDQLTNALFNMDLPFIPRVDFYTGEWFSGEKWETTTKSHRKGDPKMAKRTRDELKRAESANVIFATKQMVSEGLDIQALDVLVLSTPMGDVEQAVGRVRRWCSAEESKCRRLCPWRAGKCKEKPKPIVVDVVDENIPQLMSKWRRRRTLYNRLGMTDKKAGDHERSE